MTLTLFPHARIAPRRTCRVWSQRHSGISPVSLQGNVARVSMRLITLVVLGAAAVVHAEAAPPLDEALARQAYQVAENWVKRGGAPETTLAIPAADLAAVHVTLRLNGATLSQATATVEPLADLVDNPPRNPADAPAVDVMIPLRKAAAQAIHEAEVALTHDLGKIEPGQQVLLDVQFAHVPRPIHVDKLAQLPALLTLGADGLAMRRGEEWAWIMPASAIATNTDLRGMLNRLLASLTLPLEQLPTVGTAKGPRLYRFTAIHVVRPAVDLPAMVLYRGNALLPEAPLDDAQLRTLGGQLVDHLLRRMRLDGQFAGTYEPTADDFNPSIAREADQALAAYALARTAKLPQMDEALRTRCAEASLKSVSRLTEVFTANPAPGPAAAPSLVGVELNTTALTLLALLESPGGAELKVPRLRLGAALSAMQNADGQYRANLKADATLASPYSQALAVAAVVALYDRTREEPLLAQARAALPPLWASLTPDRLPSAMPWLVQAELELARVAKPSPTFPKIKEACEALWKTQAQPLAANTGPPHSPDTTGGFLVAESIQEEPTWQSAPILVAEALAARQEQVVAPADRPRWLVGSALGARFLSQLTMRPASCFYTRRSAAALGGVRTALWNNREPLVATAAALLAVTELRHALASITRDR
jgi:hypothetical protein